MDRNEVLQCLESHGTRQPSKGDKDAPASQFQALMPLIERGARDERNFVKKSVNWALRTIGKRDLALNATAIGVARQLAQSADAPSRWVGKDALRELESPKVQTRLARVRGVDSPGRPGRGRPRPGPK